MYGQATRELPPPPRRVYRRRGRHPLVRFLRFLVLPHTWAGLYLVWYGAVVFGVTLGGAERFATVVDKYSEFYGRRYGTGYWVTYEYEDPKGHVRARGHVSWRVFDQVRRGSPVKVRAVRILGLPRSEIVDSGSPMMDGSFFVLVVITIGFNVLMWAVFISSLKPSLRRRAIVRHGTATTGRVTGKSVKRSPQGNIVNRTVSYEYTGPDGPTAGTMHITADEYDRVHNGDAVHIVFIEGKKGASVIYGFGEYAAADDWGNELVLAAQRV